MSEPIADLRVEQATPVAAVLILEGEHDVATSRDLRETLATLLERNRIVVADLSEAEFVDSSILHALVEADRASRARGTTFRLQLGTARIVHAALEISGLLDLLECRKTREEAIGSV
jgi:anti-anti-sigma factor